MSHDSSILSSKITSDKNSPKGLECLRIFLLESTLSELVPVGQRNPCIFHLGGILVKAEKIRFQNADVSMHGNTRIRTEDPSICSRMLYH
ncbi:hypothetical protein ACTXT7_008928 [Hymenolepis weldensis]